MTDYDDDTTIRVDKETRTRLNVWAAKHDLTQREAINELIDRDEAADGSHECDCGEEFDTESALHGHETHCAEAST